MASGRRVRDWGMEGRAWGNTQSHGATCGPHPILFSPQKSVFCPPVPDLPCSSPEAQLGPGALTWLGSDSHAIPIAESCKTAKESMGKLETRWKTETSGQHAAHLPSEVSHPLQLQRKGQGPGEGAQSSLEPPHPCLCPPVPTPYLVPGHHSEPQGLWREGRRGWIWASGAALRGTPRQGNTCPSRGHGERAALPSPGF